METSVEESPVYYELKKYNEACSALLCQSKEAKLQWLQDPSEMNGDNLNSARREASRYFRNRKKEYLKDIINEVATERGLLSLAIKIEELLERKSSGSGLENREYSLGICHADHVAPSIRTSWHLLRRQAAVA
jgi:hypothetical protein